MSFPLYTTVTKSAEQVRADYLRTKTNGLRGQGIANPNTGPGSDDYIAATAIGNEIAVVHANTSIQTDALMPDTAGGSFLDRWLNIFQLGRRAATGAAGNISAPCSVASTLVPSNAQLTDTNGLRYQVVTGGIYTATNGQLTVPVQGIDTGSATNHKNGDAMKWAGAAPAFCAATATVGALGGVDGLTGGNDSEVGVDEPPRQRLLSRMANSPAGGNAADIAQWAAESSQLVQGAWIYPALLGPGTVFFLVSQLPQTVGPFGPTSKNRSIASTVVGGTIVPYVQGKVPLRALCVGASTVDVPSDIAILLNLPSAPTASPPGLGGGWLDGTPWPSSIGGTTPVTVTSAASSLVFTVNAVTPPTAGVSHIAWLSPLTWQIFNATVIAVTGTSGAYVITVDTPMTGIAAGHCIFPQSVNQSNYVSAALSAFSTMGPGEWTSNMAILSRSFRHPQPGAQWPNAFGATFLRQIINAGAEVLDANWLYRSVGSGPPTVPVAPTLDSNFNLTSAAPGLYVPRNIGWYAI